jgi:F-type H+-transporting ATPase subunit a
LTLALPLWLGRIIISIIFQYNNLFAHLVPVGTPRFLIPVIVVIESVRNIIRPLTLSIRLAANIVAGHLLLTLLGSQGANLSFINLIVLFISLYLLLLLEVAVACIQSYVFTILNSLYLNELISNKFNKTII